MQMMGDVTVSEEGKIILRAGLWEDHTQTRGPDPCSEPLQWSRPGMMRPNFGSVGGGIFQVRYTINKA